MEALKHVLILKKPKKFKQKVLTNVYTFVKMNVFKDKGRTKKGF